MKKIIIIFLMVCSYSAFANNLRDSTSTRLSLARQMADKRSKIYNPQRAFQSYSSLASSGNAEAMNGLGVLYELGIGTLPNQTEALRWFDRAGQKGYAQGWTNIALLYKNAPLPEQDFKKAYTYFQKAAHLHDLNALYWLGYMQFKGFGCSQDYQAAFANFLASAGKIRGAMYFLGICYRNGYGTRINADSAKAWLTKAAERHYNFATEELYAAKPENVNFTPKADFSVPATPAAAAVDINSDFTYKKINQTVSRNDLTGSYHGFVIKFDWSGKKVIGQSRLNVIFENKDSSLTGVWEEEDVKLPFSADITDSAVIFNSVTTSQYDHYNASTANLLLFSNARINMLVSDDHLFLTGNLQLYSIKHKEPEKPIFILLMKNGDLKQDRSTTNVDSLHFKAYPNPFTDRFQLTYSLKSSCAVKVTISNLLNGLVIYQSRPVNEEAGQHSDMITLNAQPGTYIVSLQYGTKRQTAILLKH